MENKQPQINNVKEHAEKALKDMEFKKLILDSILKDYDAMIANVKSFLTSNSQKGEENAKKESASTDN